MTDETPNCDGCSYKRGESCTRHPKQFVPTEIRATPRGNVLEIINEALGPPLVSAGWHFPPADERCGDYRNFKEEHETWLKHWRERLRDEFPTINFFPTVPPPVQ